MEDDFYGIDIGLAPCLSSGLNVLDVRHHAFELAQVFRTEEICEFESATWLELVAGLKHVACDLTAYQSASLCGPGFIYFEEKSVSATMLLTEVTRFQFAWNSIESFIGDRYSGKSDEVARLLKKFETTLDVPSHYTCAFEAFASLLEKSDEFCHLSKGDVGGFRTLPESFSLLRSLRNNLVHGFLIIPEGVGHGGKPRLASAVLYLATRVAVFVVQMLAALRFADAKFTIEHQSGSLEGDWVDCRPQDVLQFIHCQRVSC